MADGDRRAIEAAFADRVCELFRTLCLGYDGGGRDNALVEFERAVRTAQGARDAALKIVI